MANEQNLTQAGRSLSTEEAQRMGRKGGIASAKARKERKALKDTLEELLAMPIYDGMSDDIDKIKSIAGIKGKNITMQEAIMVAMLNKAAKGNVRAAEYVRDTIGEQPEQQARIDKLKAETARIRGEDPTEGMQDDGFIDALRGEVANIWDEE